MQEITSLPKELETEIVAAINQRINQYTQNVVDKPWGKYIDLYRNTNRVLKTIHVEPGKKLSLQVHKQRMEIWLVEAGRGQIVRGRLNGEEVSDITTEPIVVGDVLVIEVGEVHQLVNNSNKELIILEMQYGTCSEDDIIRFEEI